MSHFVTIIDQPEVLQPCNYLGMGADILCYHFRGHPCPRPQANQWSRHLFKNWQLHITALDKSSKSVCLPSYQPKEHCALRRSVKLEKEIWKEAQRVVLKAVLCLFNNYKICDANYWFVAPFRMYDILLQRWRRNLWAKMIDKNSYCKISCGHDLRTIENRSAYILDLIERFLDAHTTLVRKVIFQLLYPAAILRGGAGWVMATP